MLHALSNELSSFSIVMYSTFGYSQMTTSLHQDIKFLLDLGSVYVNQHDDTKF